MKLIFKGKFKSYDDLPKGELPERAVRFKEPKSLVGVNLVALPFIFLTAIVMLILMAAFGGQQMYSKHTLLGIVISLVLIVPHEFIHALFMGRDAEVFMYYSLKHLMMFVTTVSPMTKGRFILFSAMPSLILGWLPFFIGLFLFPTTDLGGILMAAGFWGSLESCADYLNIFNALVQMPKGSLTQLSGMNSYWFMPEENADK